MGLGPPVCTKCKLLCLYKAKPDYHWYCPCCSATNDELDEKGYPLNNFIGLWELDEADQKFYEQNTDFVHFILRIGKYKSEQ